jgi:hypothetical protein
MNIKRAILPLVATGGLGVALFGGAAVSTAWTGADHGNVNVSTASVGTSAPATVSLTNALPGDESPGTQWIVTNQGSTPADEVVTVAPGTTDSPTLDKYVDVFVSGQDIGTVAQLEAGNGTPLVGPNENNRFAAGESRTYTIVLGLASNAPQSVAGQSTSAVFTTTGTPVSVNNNGTDSNND